MSNKRCMGCMRTMEYGPVCPHCGYDARSVNAAHQLPAGTVLKEQYLIGRVLGQGGFGITYMGWDLYLDIPVAVKEYFPKGMVMRDCSVTHSVSDCSDIDGIQFRNNKERFLREAKMLARFSQVPEIVQIRNFFLANNTAYIVMEYVEGITLKEYVDRHGGKLSPEETFRLLKLLLEPLARVHKTGLVHRDISPDNIMILPTGIKLLDFGAVRELGASAADKSTQAILRPGYAPIEQYLKRGELGPWTDVHALCGTMYFCMTGEVPVDSPDRMLAGEDIDWAGQIPGLTSRQRAALEHGTALRVENRTVSIEQLYAELFGADTDREELRKEPRVAERKQPAEKQVHAPAAKGAAEAKKAAQKTAPASSQKQASRENKIEKKSEEQSRRKPIAPRLAAAAVIVAVALGGFALLGKNSAEPVVTEPTGIHQAQIEGTCGEGITWSLDQESGILRFSGVGEMKDFSPDEKAPWAEYADVITRVVVDAGITKIGNYAFFGMNEIRSVDFSETVEIIGSHSFWSCGIDQLTLPESLKTIEESAFCFNPVVDVVIPDGTEYLGPDCFDGCAQLRTVTIGADTRLNYDTWRGPMFGTDGNAVTIRGYTNTMVEDYAYIHCYQFQAIGDDPWDVVGMEKNNVDWAFDADTGFLKVGISSSGLIKHYTSTVPGEATNESYMRDIPGWMEFREEIITVSLGEIYDVGAHAFAHCTNLTDIHWGDYCGHVGVAAFMDTNLDHVAMDAIPLDWDPMSTNRGNVSTMAFADCKNLKMVRLHSMQNVQESAFSGCDQLGDFWQVPANGYNPNETATADIFGKGESVTIPAGLTIYSTENSGWKDVAAENGIRFGLGYLGMMAEDGGQCGKNAWWLKCQDTLVLYGSGSTWVYYIHDRLDHQELLEDSNGAGVAPEDIPGFYKYADEIKNMIIEPGITELSFSLFSGMKALEDVSFGYLDTVGQNAFQNCSSLKELYLPDSVRMIKAYAFSGCSTLESVVIQSGHSGIGEGAFENCTGLRHVWFNSSNVNHLKGDLFTPNGGELPEKIKLHFGHWQSELKRYADEMNIAYDNEIIR